MTRSSTVPRWSGGLLGALLLAGTVALSGCGGDDAGGGDSGGDTYTFAVVGPLTGDTAAYGTNLVKGVQLAVDEINAGGGASGKKLAIKSFDDKCNPTEAANVASRVASDRSIFGVMGHVCSSATLAGLPIYERSGLAVVSGSSTAPKVTDPPHANFSRTIPSDAIQGAQSVAFTASTLNRKRIAIIYSADDFGQGLHAAAVEQVPASGAQLVGDVTYTPSTTKDFTPQLTKLAAARPEALLMLGYYNDMGTMVTQLGRAGLSDVALVGCAGIAQPDYAKLGGRAAEGTTILSYYDPANPLPANQAFVKRFREKYGTDPNEQAAYGYELPFVYKAAIESGADRAGLAEAVRKVTYQGPTGTTAFTDAGDVKGKVGVVLRVGGGKLVLDPALTKQATEVAGELGT
jgi:branched-chain amino acid transport system substrate-binding protein